MVELHLREAKKNLDLLDEAIGKPSVPTMPQTINQSIVLILKDLHKAVEAAHLKLCDMEAHTWEGSI